MDRDCKLGKSFHVLDIERFGAENVISISSIPEYNKEARRRGVKKVILKDFENMDKFIDDVVKEIKKRLRGTSLVESLKGVIFKKP